MKICSTCYISCSVCYNPAAAKSTEYFSMPTPTSPFAKTRTDHATETAEDYVEAIEDILKRQSTCRVKDLAAEMEVSHVTVTRILQRLSAEGLIDKNPYGPCTLTDTGRAMARRSRRRHALLLEFLISIGVPPADAQRDAEGMEHHVSEATLAAMKAAMKA
ncbi:MAG: manganese-binding transcriptional regulator MntR [Phycisphaerales bacterium]|nr:manganese-binding transcriptional regulator MntR [Phycisphaerales bacterium]MDP6312414.1 manganese-binding transcriptional regulator MntR [Phycisphaerales bacterium]MDP7188225.1 manganese-binding transcriptional regulator MntR [Phycisphaerales bacterium]MDP7520176.1 manganese-binding transcriptional regulator MntR [Phycisphaerales bacterium]